MTTGDDGGARPRTVHVSELLAAHGRTVAPSGRRRRRAEPDEVAPESAPVVEGPVGEKSATAPVGEQSATAPVGEQSATALLDLPSRGAPTERDEVTDRASADGVALDMRAMAAATEAESPADQSPVDVDVDVDVLVVPADQSPVDVDVDVPVVPGDVAVEGEPGATGAEPTPVPARRSPVREWAVVGAQLVGALVGGAALWLAFRWLWEWHSVVALVLSAVVIVGLVVVVRVLRRAEDLFSTVLAVLAGLIVTVSPPVLTLTGR